SYHHASSAPEFPLVVTPLTFELQPASAHTHFKSMYNICNSINLHYKPITIKVPIEGSSQGKRLHNFPMHSYVKHYLKQPKFQLVNTLRKLKNVRCPPPPNLRKSG